ncbi:MAG: ABC transporter substrate-binding protein [Dehalococcoidales bacterium]
MANETSVSYFPIPKELLLKKKIAWWDKLGKPQYGGEMVISSPSNIENFDPYFSEHLTQIYTGWLERLHAEDWTLDPAVFDYKLISPHNYLKGNLAESWEFTEPGTLVFRLRKGIRWQDIPPVNGREFTADDVVYHFHRLYGLGSGFTSPSPYQDKVIIYQDLVSVAAMDKYTVAFKWKTTNPEFIMEILVTNHSPILVIEAREAVEKWGDVNDWHHAIGTGPFILKEFISGSSATLVKNPNYWGHDERHPKNKLPYVDKLKIVIIPDKDKALEAFLAGRIDAIDGISLEQAQAIQKSNPEILQIPIPSSSVTTIDPRNDTAPFNDIRVRKAMQMAINLPDIAKNHYGGTVEPYPSTLSSKLIKIWGDGWAFPYEAWPQDLKDEYAYNPTAARQLLADAGYANGFKTNVLADTKADLKLLQIVKSYFAEVGIQMEIRPMDSNYKHDQLAYPGGSLGLDVEPFRQLPRLRTGYPLNTRLRVSDPVFDAFFPRAQAAADLDETKQIFREANEYVARQHFTISLLQRPTRYSLHQPWLKGYNAQFGSTSWSPPSLSFYTARFWIDRKLKKSMGH